MADPIGTFISVNVPLQDDEGDFGDDAFDGTVGTTSAFISSIITVLRPRDVSRLPPFVDHDPLAPVRTRKHLDLVALILNSLIRREELVRLPGKSAQGIWALGYLAGLPSSWLDPVPETVQGALDRLAAAVKALQDAPASTPSSGDGQDDLDKMAFGCGSPF